MFSCSLWRAAATPLASSLRLIDRKTSSSCLGGVRVLGSGLGLGLGLGSGLGLGLGPGLGLGLGSGLALGLGSG
eukprot:scaffold379_cov48-Phaeocystis_antarctica.AAC.2